MVWLGNEGVEREYYQEIKQRKGYERFGIDGKEDTGQREQ